MKLWKNDRGADSPAMIMEFTIGRDKELDMLLAKYDVQASLAHVHMLRAVDLLSDDEHNDISKGLQQIASEIENGQFLIEDGVEDVHSQIELLLTERIGEAGKKIHSGRSRNDQIAVDMKLYLRDAMLDTTGKVCRLFEILQQLSGQYKDVLMPGYTHLQIAMPSSFGLWFGAYAESLTDDLEMIAAAYNIANQNPLGSGAGYGSSFPLDRSITTKLLGFRSMHYNAVYAQMSRGKTEKICAMALSTVAATIGKMAMDICLYQGQNFGFITFPDALTTGSSIMPHKKNPDIFELIRGKCSRLQSVPNELSILLQNLPSGYHRDLQLTKEIIFPAIKDLDQCLEMLLFALPQIRINEHILQSEKYKYLFTVEAVNLLVDQGVSFRDAYHQVGDSVAKGTFHFDGFDIEKHTHEGSMGNLCNKEIEQKYNEILLKFK